MRSYLIPVWIIVFWGCQHQGPGNTENIMAAATELSAYRDLISSDNLTVGLPEGLKYDNTTQHLFIHDLGGQIIEMDESNNVVKVL